MMYPNNSVYVQLVPPPTSSVTGVNGTGGTYSEAERFSIIVAGTLLSIVTAGGNLLVLLSFKVDKTLQIISNYFLFSLAVADLAIGLISCPFMTLYTVNLQWTLGYSLCQFWLSVDYLMSNASVWNLLLISLDRYFSVTRPLTYRPKRTTKKALVMIASTYVLSLVLWPPWIIAWPYIEGRFVLDETECMVQFLKTNPAVTIGTIMAAFYIPVSVMVILYARVFWVTETRQKQLSKLQGFQKDLNKREGGTTYKNKYSQENSANNTAAAKAAVEEATRPLQEPPPTTVQTLDFTQKVYGSRKWFCCRKRSGRLRRRNEDFGSSMSCAEEESNNSQAEVSDDNMVTVASFPAESTAIVNDGRSRGGSGYETYTVVIKFPSNKGGSKRSDSTEEPRISLYDSTEDSTIAPMPDDKLLSKQQQANKLHGVHQKTSKVSLKSPASAMGLKKANKTNKKSSEKKQERKAAKTLSAILLAFVLTWAPYSIIICIEAFRAHTVPPDWFTFSYYLCYLNSTINPILYACCNENFRRTYIRILKCQFKGQGPQYKHHRQTAFHK